MDEWKREAAAVIGARLRSLRLRRGMSQRALADRSGLSAGYLSMVENGHRLLDRASYITALADALRVAPSELAGASGSLDQPGRATVHDHIPALRLVLMGFPPSGRPLQRRLEIEPPARLSQRVRTANARYHAAEFDTLAATLPDLVHDLREASGTSRGKNRIRLLRLLADAYHPACALLLKSLGYVDLAYLAVTRAAEAIAELDDPVRAAVSDFFHAHVLLSAGSPSQALARAGTAADGLQGRLGHRGAKALLGELHLISATSLTQTGQRSTEEVEGHLAEASRLAVRTGETKAWHLNFGPANVAVHQVSLNTALGRHGEAVHAGHGVHPAGIATAGRRAAFHGDLGRALTQLPHRQARAVEAFLDAEEAAPQRVHADPLIRDSVGHLLGKTLPSSTRRSLAGLAHRMGLPV
ncbi:helix-turn-helix domain-containing protein [Streptomyces sp. NPDC004609]|uniref:helix-turn-helix domain-containing protein n=1 Tax=Streptomyces sp. NPDC004609 TaxID=3364704 RepID=UPI0036CC773A